MAVSKTTTTTTIVTTVTTDEQGNPTVETNVTTDTEKQSNEENPIVDPPIKPPVVEPPLVIQEETRWVPADLHLHTHGCKGGSLTPKQLIQEMKDNNLELGTCFAWGYYGYENDPIYFTGEDYLRDNIDDPILHYDLEISVWRASKLGHLLLHNLDSINFSPNPRVYPATGITIADWAKQQNSDVVIGMAHCQTWPDNYLPPPKGFRPYELPIHTVLGQMDYLAVEHQEHGGDAGGDALFLGTRKIWNTLLNAGYKVSLAGGSDYSCIGFHPGSCRTLAKVDGQLTYKKYMAAVKAGKTCISNIGNHYIDLNISTETGNNKVGLGEELHTSGVQEIVIDIETNLPEATTVEILLDGQVATTFSVFPGKYQTQTKLNLGKSCWISARAKGVQAGAISLIINEKPIYYHHPEALKYLMDYVVYMIESVNNGDYGEEAKEALDYYNHAYNLLEQRSNLAKGV